MPTNLTAEALRKKKEVESARTPEEKLQKLEEYLSLIPKHKGTEKLIKQIRRQIASLRREISKSNLKRSSRKGIVIERIGDVQVALIGMIDSYKNQLMADLVENVLKFYSPIELRAGIFKFGLLRFQVIELPAISNFVDSAYLRQATSILKNTDIIVAVCCQAEELSYLKDKLWESMGILLTTGSSRILVKRLPPKSGLKIVVEGSFNGTIRDVERLLKKMKFDNYEIRIEGSMNLQFLKKFLKKGGVFKPSLILLMHTVERSNFSSDTGLYGFVYDFNDVNRKIKFGEKVLKALDLIRIYTKRVGEPNPDLRPVLMKNGSTVLDLAKRIHKTMYRNFKYAKVWSKELKHSVARVGRNYKLKDCDIVEIHFTG